MKSKVLSRAHRFRVCDKCEYRWYVAREIVGVRARESCPLSFCAGSGDRVEDLDIIRVVHVEDGGV